MASNNDKWQITNAELGSSGVSMAWLFLPEENGSYLADLKGLGQSQKRPSGRLRQPRTITSTVQKELPMPGSM